MTVFLRGASVKPNVSAGLMEKKRKKKHEIVCHLRASCKSAHSCYMRIRGLMIQDTLLLPLGLMLYGGEPADCRSLQRMR